MAFKNLEKEYNYLIDNCATKINSDCKVILLHFNESYKLILDIATILYYDNENDLRHYVIDLVHEINDYCTNELLHYNRILPRNLNQEILRKTNFITENQIIVQKLFEEFNYTLRRKTNKVEKKLKRLQNLAIDIFFIRKELKENKISPDA